MTLNHSKVTSKVARCHDSICLCESRKNSDRLRGQIPVHQMFLSRKVGGPSLDLVRNLEKRVVVLFFFES